MVLSLFDVQNSRKISADFHVDLNNPLVRSMILPPSAQMNGGVDQLHGETLLSELPEKELQYPRKVRFKKREKCCQTDGKIEQTDICRYT